MMKILMVASEAAPFAKTGGLADVLGALPAALRAQGNEIAVVLPRYRSIALAEAERVFDDLTIWLGKSSYRVNLYRKVERGVPYYFVDMPALFDRTGLYGDSSGDYPDNPVRFGVLCRAALAIVRHLFRAQVIHCHDWQAALTPVYARHLFATDPTFYGLKFVITIHNLGYQGIFPATVLEDIGLDKSLVKPSLLEFFGKINLLKGAMVFSDAISTVSPTYAREIQTEELGFGLDGLLRQRANMVHGILNGGDYREWNPQTDRYLSSHYSAEELDGKAACKHDLLAEFGLPQEGGAPVIGIISRFVNQKGFDLIAEIAPELVAEDVKLAVLGTGEPQYENLFRELAAAHPAKVGVRIAYDNRLAHLIEAGSDLFLMPSMYEPCGLNQIYSLRYGTVPVVRATGGLDDTIDESTGFKFRDYSGAALKETLHQALDAYKDRQEWTERMRTGMRKDFSWDASAAEYARLYSRLTG
ncbi:MAG: glycogen synthase GlgA [Bryobacterales bacterium]|nr:glycogen synthase GlgA [Bryobacterales bacterium]